jgi:hypothetical protein
MAFAVENCTLFITHWLPPKSYYMHSEYSHVAHSIKAIMVKVNKKYQHQGIIPIADIHIKDPFHRTLTFL